MLKLLNLISVASFTFFSCSFFNSEEDADFDTQSIIGDYQYVTDEVSTFKDSGLLQIEFIKTEYKEITLNNYKYKQNIHEYIFTEINLPDANIKRKYTILIVPYANQIPFLFLNKQANLAEKADTLSGLQRYGFSIDGGAVTNVDGCINSQNEIFLSYRLQQPDTTIELTIVSTKKQ